jgi:hypothetical protein
MNVDKQFFSNFYLHWFFSNLSSLSEIPIWTHQREFGLDFCLDFVQEFGLRGGWWPRLTVETEMYGDLKSTVQMKGVLPWLVRWARHAGTIDFYPALAALVSPVQNIFSTHTLFQFMCLNAQQAGAGSREGPPVSEYLSPLLYLPSPQPEWLPSFLYLYFSSLCGAGRYLHMLADEWGGAKYDEVAMREFSIPTNVVN